MKVKCAIVREPGKSYRKCISSHPLHHTLNISKAKKQHYSYCETLSNLGLEVIKLLPIDGKPDACFVEDTAVVQGKRAFVTRMAKESRRGEDVEVEKLLEEFFDVKKAFSPATIEGGDVIHLPSHLISGVTQRTNMEGVAQMRSWLKVQVDTIVDNNIVHLKSYVNYIGKKTILVTMAYQNHPCLEKFYSIVIPNEEYYATNCLIIEGTVIMSSKFPNVVEMVKETGFEVLSLDMSEFEKCEGALTCLSLIF